MGRSESAEVRIPIRARHLRCTRQMPEQLFEVLQLRLLVAVVMAPMNAAGSQTPFRMTAKERHLSALIGE